MKMQVYLFIIFLLLSIGAVSAQQTIEITVLDSVSGEPISDATIVDQSNHVLSISSGSGKLKVETISSDRKLSIQHIAYTNYELKIPLDVSPSGMTVRLKPRNFFIEEVEINTGYERIPRERSTGAFSSISNRQLQERIEPNILDRLEGIAPGVQFDRRTGTAQLNIRGINKLSSGGREPLVVVDDFPYEGDLGNINPNDVESVSILKDAVATSIWGARAGNGVIVINLKKPQGNFKIDFTSNTSIVSKPNLGYHQQMTSEDFIFAERYLYEQGFYTPYLTSTNSRMFVFSPVVSLLYAVDNGQIEADLAEDKIALFKGVDYRNDLKKYFYRNEFNQQYSLSASMQRADIGYRASIGYDNNNGAEVYQKGKRFSFLSSFYYEPVRKLRVELATSYNNRSLEGSLNFPNYPLNPGGYKAHLYPYAQLVDAEGSGLNIPYQYDMGYTADMESKGLLDWNYAPYEDLAMAMSRTVFRHLSFTPKLQYQLFPGISLSAIYNYEQQTTSLNGHYSKQSYFVRNMVNRYTDMSSGTPKQNVPYGDILNINNGELIGHKFRIQGNINRSIGEKHQVSGLVGSEFTAILNTGRTDRLYGYDPDKLTTMPVDYKSMFPIYDGLGSASTIPNQEGVSERRTRFVSLYANGSYSYANKYTVSFSARRDASNVFGVQANDRWNPLWSIGAAWSISNEPWFPTGDVVNNMRMRATYGHSGNSGGLIYTDVIMQYNSAERYYGMPYGRITSPPNPNLKWEDVAQTNVALDFSLFKSRLNGSIEVYRKKVTDLISNDPIDPTVGFANVDRNVASIKGKGIDLQLNALIVDREIKWQSRLFLTYNKDIVDTYKGTKFQGVTYASSGGKSISPIVDYVLYPVFSYRFEGLNSDTGDPIGYYNGAPTENYADILRDSVENLHYHGSGLPLYHGAISNSVSWNGFDLSFTVAFKFASFFMKPTIHYNRLINDWDTHADFAKRWQKKGDEQNTTVPSFVYPANQNRDNFYAYSSANVEKGDLFRLQNIKLAYTLNAKKQRRNWGVNRLMLYVSVNNLGVLWSATDSGYDPDFTHLPLSRNVNMGLNLNF